MKNNWFSAFLASREATLQGRMSAPTSEDCTRLLEFEENAARMGARFFRVFAGADSRRDADAIDPDEIRGFLRVTSYSLIAALGPRKSLAGKGIPKNLTSHLLAAFPQQLRGVGATLRAGTGIKISDRWQREHCESTEASIELDGGKVFSLRLSWEWRVPEDIEDPTEVTPLALGEGMVIPANDGESETFKARQVGFTPRDVGYTGDQLLSHGSAAFERGIRAGINRVYGHPDEWTPPIVEHKGLDLLAIDAVLTALDAIPVIEEITPTPAPRKARARKALATS